MPSSTPRPGWRRTTTGIARRAASTIVGHQRSVDQRLDAIERRLADIDGQLRELREIAETQVDVENQSTELLGRLLRAATSRIDVLEERAGREG
jgi:hypothetical protein